MAAQYIYTMQNLRKVVPPNREILRGIWLSFFPGAKIGVLGQNGAGKSSLLRIMAGVDQDFIGEARPADGIRVGFLSQEPQLDPQKDVLGNVAEGVKETRALLQRFEDLSMKLGEDLSPEAMDKVMEEHGKVQDAIEAANAWELDRTLEIAMDALRLPPGDADVTKLSGGERRRVALCQLLLSKPDMLLLDELGPEHMATGKPIVYEFDMSDPAQAQEYAATKRDWEAKAKQFRSANRNVFRLDQNSPEATLLREHGWARAIEK